MSDGQAFFYARRQVTFLFILLRIWRGIYVPSAFESDRRYRYGPVQGVLYGICSCFLQMIFALFSRWSPCLF